MKLTKDEFFSMLENGDIDNFSINGVKYYSFYSNERFSWKTVTDKELDEALKEVVNYYKIKNSSTRQNVAKQFVQNFKKTRKIQKNMPFLDEIPEKFREVIKNNRK